MNKVIVEPLSQAEARFAVRLQRWADQAVVAIDAAEIAAGAAAARPVASRPAARFWPALDGWRAIVAIALAIALLAIGLGAASRLLEVSPAPTPTHTTEGRQSPDPPQPFEGIWPAFRLLSSESAGVSIQVPTHWHREVGAPQGFELLLEAGTGNAGLNVMVPTSGGTDLESAVSAIQESQWIGDWRTYAKSDLMHGTHRAVRLARYTRPADNGIGGHIVYVVERVGQRPLVVELAWDSVPDLGYIEKAILRSFNPDGAQPAVLADYPSGSLSWVTMTDAACTVAGPLVTSDGEVMQLTVANLSRYDAAFHLLRASNYEDLEVEARAEAVATAAGLEPPPGPHLTAAKVAEIRLQHGSVGTLTTVDPLGRYAVLCVPLSRPDRVWSANVPLTLPFGMDTPEP